MKKLNYIVLSTVMTAFAAITLCSAAPAPAASQAPAKVRTVNFKKCVEESKLGKQEQSAFEALKKQMETVLLEKEKTLNDMATKLEDVDFVDSLSAEAETEMKRKFRTLSQEYQQLQTQYMQTLQQTNYKVVQKITELVSAASTEVAKQNGYDLVINDETVFFTSPALDVSAQIVTEMNKNYDNDSSNKPAASPAK